MTANANISFTLVASPATTIEEETTPGSSGSPTYYPTESNLQEGYTKQLYTNWKLSFKSNEESHQLKLDSFDKVNKTATITISSDPQTKTLSVGEEWKVNLNNNTYYDLLVRLDNVTSTRANVFIKNINESIPSENVKDVKNDIAPENIIGDKICFGRINCWYYIGGGLIEQQVVDLGKTRKVVLRLTKKGGEVFEELQTGGNESIVHNYWKRFYSERFKDAGYDVKQEAARDSGCVDVLAVKGEDRIAIEIETGKSDVVRNVKQDLMFGCTRILVVATDKWAFEKVERDLAKAGLLGLDRIKVVLQG